MSQAKLFIDDTPGQNMLRIAANARRLKMRHDLRMVVIDYLQLIDPDNAATTGRSRWPASRGGSSSWPAN